MTQEEVDRLIEAVFAKPLLLEQVATPTTRELMRPEPERRHKRQKRIHWRTQAGPKEPPMKVVRVAPSAPPTRSWKSLQDNPALRGPEMEA